MIKGLINIKFSDCVSILALMLAVFVFIRDCSQDKKIEELNYWSNAMQFKPSLKVVGDPITTAFQFEGDGKFATRDILNASDTTTKFIDIHCTLTINFKLNIMNEGNTMADVYAVFWSDTSKGRDKMRELLFNKDARERELGKPIIGDYLTLKSVPPGDTVDYEMTHTVQFFEENDFTMHFLFLYRNEIGTLYDTYYWACYNATPILGKVEFAIIDGKLVSRIAVEKTQFKDFLKLYDHAMSSKTYSKSEAEDILDFLKRHRKKVAG
ncbi:MAG: hypothetical protein WBD28_09465 [Candidatus Zixiibacteriota bacterium]